MDIKIILYFLFVFYLYYTRFGNKIEAMENNDENIKDKTRKIYLSDVIAIKYLNKFADKIQKEGMAINTDIDFKGKLIIPENGSIIVNNQKISNFNQIITDKDVVTFRSLANKDLNNNCEQTKRFRSGEDRHIRLEYGKPIGHYGRNINTKHQLYLTRNVDNIKQE